MTEHRPNPLQLFHSRPPPHRRRKSVSCMCMYTRVNTIHTPPLSAENTFIPTHAHKHACTNTQHTQARTHTYVRTDRSSSQHLYEASYPSPNADPVLILTPILIQLALHTPPQSGTARLHPPQHQDLALAHSLLPQRLQRVQPLHCN